MSSVRRQARQATGAVPLVSRRTARRRPGFEERLTADKAHSLADRLLHSGDWAKPRSDFVQAAAACVLVHSGADRVYIWLREDGRLIECRAVKGQGAECATRPLSRRRGGRRAESVAAIREHTAKVLGLGEARAGCLRRGGVLRTSNSAALIFLGDKGGSVGFLGLSGFGKGRNSAGYRAGLERIGSVLGYSLAAQRTQAALRERVKELTCLYGITQVAQEPARSLDEILNEVVALLPGAWQYPEAARARILLDGVCYETCSERAFSDVQAAPLIVGGRNRGQVVVGYTQACPAMDEGPFLAEERSLLAAVAVQLSLIVERREAAVERVQLEDQIRHADRLATIGLLAAGVAHELNEPLGSILGFTQLAQKATGLPEAAGQDLDKVVSATLHAREVVRKLRLFARQMPPSKVRVNVSHVVEESLGFLEARMAKQSIVLVRRLDPVLPVITADPFQLQQVTVNLAVNAVHAMPEGGTLTVSTWSDGRHVLLAVEDTGIGMNREVLDQVFLPFFTTKDVDEGTGLGLSVVHGIVKEHGGAIRVESTFGRGSRFEIELPLVEDGAVEG